MKYIWHFKINFTAVSEHRGHVCEPFGLIHTQVDSTFLWYNSQEKAREVANADYE